MWELPDKGSTGWRHPNFGGTYRVHSVGPVWVTLKAETSIHGYPNTTQVLVALWPAHEGPNLRWKQRLTEREDAP